MSCRLCMSCKLLPAKKYKEAMQIAANALSVNQYEWYGYIIGRHAWQCHPCGAIEVLVVSDEIADETRTNVQGIAVVGMSKEVFLFKAAHANVDVITCIWVPTKLQTWWLPWKPNIPIPTPNKLNIELAHRMEHDVRMARDYHGQGHIIRAAKIMADLYRFMRFVQQIQSHGSIVDFKEGNAIAAVFERVPTTSIDTMLSFFKPTS